MLFYIAARGATRDGCFQMKTAFQLKGFQPATIEANHEGSFTC
jgi:hypothetical protein